MTAGTPRSFEGDDEFLAAACAAASRSSGADALETLGWWDLLPELDDPDARAAVFAVFRAQGRSLTGSIALGALMAHPYPVPGDRQPGSVAAAVTRRSLRRGTVVLVVGDVPSELLLVDRPGVGASLVPVADVDLLRVEIPGRLALHEVVVDLDAAPISVPEVDAAPARRRSHALGRMAMSLEMLGAAEATLALAVEHVQAREQFGKPIGSFQAIRHLLAWARTDCAAVEAVARHAVALDRVAPTGFDEILKALAGRNARRACERTLQSFGGVGFTAEHDHHHFHSRVLALDSLLGTSSELTRELGARLRTSGSDPAIAAGVLVPVDAR